MTEGYSQQVNASLEATQQAQDAVETLNATFTEKLKEAKQLATSCNDTQAAALKLEESVTEAQLSADNATKLSQRAKEESDQLQADMLNISSVPVALLGELTQNVTRLNSTFTQSQVNAMVTTLRSAIDEKTADQRQKEKEIANTDSLIRSLQNQVTALNSTCGAT